MLVKITERSYAHIMLMIAVLIWGIATPIIKATVGVVPPLTFLMLRFLIAGFITIPMTVYYFNKVKLNNERMRKILTASSIGHVLALALIFIGLSMTTSNNGSIITSFSPLLVTAMGFFILREHITRKEIEGTLLALIGTLIIIFEPVVFGNQNAETARYSLIGNFIFFLGIVADSYYSIYVKKHIAEDKLITPFMQICISFIFAAVIFIPLSIGEQYYNYRQTESGSLRMCNSKDIDKYNYSTGTICDKKGCYPTKERNNYFCLNDSAKTSFSTYITNDYIKYISGPSLLGILYMAILSGIIAYVSYNIGLKHIEASEASVFYYLQPVFGIPVAIFLLGEPISLMFAIGAAIIVTGIYLVEKR